MQVFNNSYINLHARHQDNIYLFISYLCLMNAQSTIIEVLEVNTMHQNCVQCKGSYQNLSTLYVEFYKTIKHEALKTPFFFPSATLGTSVGRSFQLAAFTHFQYEIKWFSTYVIKFIYTIFLILIHCSKDTVHEQIQTVF